MQYSNIMMLCVLMAIIAGSSIIINRECNFYID